MPPSEITTPSPRLRARSTSRSISAKLPARRAYLIESPVKCTQRAPSATAVGRSRASRASLVS